MKNCQIRNDDVLQISGFTKNQVKTMGDKMLYEHFLEADRVFEKYDYPCILAILSEGINGYPDWVKHIKNNIHRYIIELHGSAHYRYGNLSEERGKKELKEALDKIEETFGVRPTTWYLPFGRKSQPKWGKKVCEELRIKYDVPTGKIDAKRWIYGYRRTHKPPFYHINFHFWDEQQVKHIEQVIEIIKGINP